MELQGERVIEADRATVWQALNDPDILRACIPGCDELEKTGEDSFEGQITQKVGPVKARFRGAVTLSDVVVPESYRIDGEGKGGAAGFAKGGADVRLTETDEGHTRLAFEADAKVGGKLAQLGNRLIDGFARKMADQFFDRFKAEVEGKGAATTPADGAPDRVVAADTSTAVTIDQTSDDPISHPARKPGSSGPVTADEPVSGASAGGGPEPVTAPVATQEGHGVGGSTDGVYQAAMSKEAARVQAAQDDPDRTPSTLDEDPVKGPPDTPERAGTDGVVGGAGSDPARVAGHGAADETPVGKGPDGPRSAGPAAKADDRAAKGAAEDEPKEKKSWFGRLFGG